MTPFDPAELRRLAAAATPGPWFIVHSCSGAANVLARQGPIKVCPAIAHGESDAAYIAAANPAVILALLAERDALVQVAEEAAVVEASSAMWPRLREAIIDWRALKEKPDV